MDIKVWMYLTYLAVSIGLTVWVARALARNGLVFLQEVFDDDRLARAVNSLLVVGFYLLNLGYVGVAMRYGGQVGTTSRALEELSVKVGLVLLVLGVLHFFNVLALNRYRRSRLRQAATHPPLAPVGRLPMAPPVPGQAGFPSWPQGTERLTQPGQPVPTGQPTPQQVPGQPAPQASGAQPQRQATGPQGQAPGTQQPPAGSEQQR